VCISASHTREDLDYALEVIEDGMRTLGLRYGEPGRFWQWLTGGGRVVLGKCGGQQGGSKAGGGWQQAVEVKAAQAGGWEAPPQEPLLGVGQLEEQHSDASSGVPEACITVPVAAAPKAGGKAGVEASPGKAAGRPVADLTAVAVSAALAAACKGAPEAAEAAAVAAGGEAGWTPVRRSSRRAARV
jgi:hypothetical protein